MSKWSTALFDLDGTLTDPGEGIIKCIEHAFRGLGLDSPPTEELGSWIGPPLYDSFFAACDDEQLATRAVDLYRERFASDGLYENRMIAGVDGALDTLTSSGVRCFVASSKPAVFVERIVRHFRMDQWLTGVYGSELDGRFSDKAELLAQLRVCESIDPRQTVMIGDRYHDLDGAQANNMDFIGVTWGYGSREELEQAGAGIVIDTLAALLEQFELDNEEQA
jgi:phosphoglycolate phosphatase